MIPAILTAAKRRVLCLLGRHDWTPCELRPATYWYYEGGKWHDTGVGMGGYLGTRLALAGEEVTFIARRRNLEAIKAKVRFVVE